MTQSDSTAGTGTVLDSRPGHKIIRIGADGAASIEAYRCPDCGAVVAELTRACRACASRKPLDAFRPAETGQLFSWSVVHRSYPGIAVPFVSAIVDLDGGLTVKGTLRLDDLASLRVGMPVRLVIDDAGGTKDSAGRLYVGFHFLAEGAVA